LVSATAALWPAREALGTPALAAWRGVEASPRRVRGPDWPPKGHGWWPVGAGGAAGVGPRPCPGGARIPRPGGATWEGVRARCRDVLPMPIRASEVGSGPGRPLARSRDVCGGACRAPAVASRNMARDRVAGHLTKPVPSLAILDFAGLPPWASAGESRHAVGVSTDAGVSSVCPALFPYHRGRRCSRRSSRWRASLTRKARPRASSH
jgi:hypothetical protein